MSALLNIDWRTLPNAPPPGTRLCGLHDLIEGKMQLLRLSSSAADPDFQIIVLRQRDTLHAYVNQCPHHWLPMQRSDGEFLKWSENELMCAHHSAVFDLSNAGRCTMGPCLGSNLIRVPLAVIDGEICLQ